MSLRRIFGLTLLFLFFETVVAVLTSVLKPDTNVFLACAAMTGLALGVWLVFALVTRLWMRPRTPQSPPTPKPVSAAKPVVSGEDRFLQDFRALVREASGRLPGSSVDADPLATAPLFLVIGPEGAGKTSVLANSGMEPRLLAGEAFKDATIVSTKSCNLWYATDAVFADFSGRVLMQEPDHWEGMLRILSARQRMPWWKKFLLNHSLVQSLRGVVLVCDVNIFNRNDDPQRVNQLAQKLQERLQSVGTIFGKDFPVYLIFNKADGIAHFPEFFANLTGSEDRRILGATLPLAGQRRANSEEIYADREGKRLTHYFNRLYMALADKRLVLLAREDIASRKSPAYEFPRELKRIRGELIQFVTDVFRPNPLQPGPGLRGFYFSGVRQVARSMSVEERSADFSIVKKGSDATVFFGRQAQVTTVGNKAAPKAPGTAMLRRWAFLGDLFTSVVLRDHAGVSAPRTDSRQQLYRNAALGAVTVVFLVLCMTWANSWRHNRALLEDVRQTVAALPEKGVPANFSERSLEDLESMRAKLIGLEGYERDGAPFGFRWGLYSGGRPTAALHRAYFDWFRRLFLDPTLGTLTNEFNRLDNSGSGNSGSGNRGSGNPDSGNAGSANSGATATIVGDISPQLKAYRIIAAGKCKPDEELLTSVIPVVWSSAVPASADVMALADKQIRFYVSELMVSDPYQQRIGEDAEAVKRAQAYLLTLKGPEKMLAALVDRVNHDHQGDSISHYASNYAEVLGGVDVMQAGFTREGWDVVIKDISDGKLEVAGEPCVVGTGAALSGSALDPRTGREVQSLFVKEYIQHWKKFISGHHVLPYAGVADGSRKLRVLADNNRSPLLALAYMASRNTDIPSTSGQSRVEQTVNTVAKYFPGLKQKRDQANKEIDQATADLVSPAEITRAFQPVRATVAPANRDQWLSDSNREYMASLAELGDALGGLGPRPDPLADQSRFDRVYKAEERASAAARQLEQTFNNTPQQVDIDLKRLLEEPIENAKAVVPSDPTLSLKQQANRGAQRFCDSLGRLKAKYPFNPRSTEEASIDDLVRIFAPGTGELTQFVQSQPFGQLLQRQGGTWTQNPAVSQPRLSPSFLSGLTELSQFAEILFPDGGRQPRFDYKISLSATAKVQFELEADGHIVSYAGKPTGLVSLGWPSLASPGARLAVKSGLTLTTQSPGLWGIFHLLQEAENPSPGMFAISKLRFAGSESPLQDSNGQPFTLQIRVDPPASAIFSRGFFSRPSCVARAVP